MERKVFKEKFKDIYYNYSNSPNWNMSAYHYHRNYEILLFMSDGGTFLVGDRSYSVQKGDLFVIHDKDYHRSSGGKNIPFCRYVLMFYPEKFRQMEDLLGYPLLDLFENRPENFSHKINLTGANLALVVQLLQKIDQHYSTIEEDPFSRVSVDLYIVEMLLTLQKLYYFFLEDDLGKCRWTNLTTTQGGYNEDFASRSRVENIKLYVQQRVHEPLGLSEIAAQFYMSPYHLSHYFKKSTGFTLFEYIKTQKIIAAKKLLKQEIPVTEVALRLGYSSDSHFIAVFKQETGITPKKYAREKSLEKQEEKK